MAGLSGSVAEGLECSLCYELLREPKLLSCSHTFCQECLSSLYESQTQVNKLSCPLCRQITEVKNGEVSKLQTNIPLKSLVEDVKMSMPLCTVCDPDVKSTSEAYCCSCEEHMCGACLAVHEKWRKNANHKVLSEDEIKGGAVEVKQFCRRHPQKEKEWVCTSCNVFVCFICRVLDHSGADHKIQGVTGVKVSESVQDQIDNLQKRAKDITAFLETQDKMVSELTAKFDVIFGQRMADINAAFDESILELTRQRDELIDKCTQHQQKMKEELQKVKENNCKAITSIQSTSELLGKEVKDLIDDQILLKPTKLSDQLQVVLDRNTCSSSRSGSSNPTNSTKGTENTNSNSKTILPLQSDTIQAPSPETGPDLPVHILEQVGAWKLEKFGDYQLPPNIVEGLRTLVPLKDGRVVVVLEKGGLHFVEDTGRIHKKVLKDIKLDSVAVLKDERYVVKNRASKIMLYTSSWVKLDVRFHTYEEADGCMDVDQDDDIYVSYWKLKKVCVFRPEGGVPIREFSSLSRYVDRMSVSGYTKMLVTGDYGSATVLDSCSRASAKMARPLHAGQRDYEYVTPAVLRKDSILVACQIKGSKSLRIEHYTREFEFIRTVLADFEIDGLEFKSAMKELYSGFIVLFTRNHVYFFKKVRL